MKILGKRIKIFGGGMNKVNFLLPYVQDKAVLDIGVVAHRAEAYQSPNWLHKHLVRASATCVGIDIVHEGIDHLTRLGFDVRFADAQQFTFDKEFEVVIAGDILEHLHDFRGFFDSVDGVLKPGGLLIITTANPWFIVRIAQAMLTNRVHENPEHTVWFSMKTLTQLLNRYRYSVLHAQYGSSEEFLSRYVFLPRIVRHTGIWMVARRSAETPDPGCSEEESVEFEPLAHV
jgi:SAM-dependent methyltransferase